MSSLSESSVLAGASGATADPGYVVDQSIRFNNDDSAYLSRSQPTTTTTNKLFTISFWIKRSVGTVAVVWCGHLNNSNYNWMGFNNDDTFFTQFYSGGSNIFVQTTTRKFRDPAAWYHIVYIYDSAEAISSERSRLYVNGERTDLAQYTSNTLYPSQNGSTYWIYTGVTNYIGLKPHTTVYSDFSVAELAMFQDQEYGPENFGETKTGTDIWVPKDGIADLNFGDSGFYIKGEDSSDLGNDSGTANSGNGYDFTASGLAANDQITDSPTNNFAVLNSIDKGGNTTLANGDLEFQSSSDGGVRSTVFFNAAKYYIEAIVGTFGSGFSFGIANIDRSLTADSGEDLADFYGWYINPLQNWIASGSNPWNTGSNSNSGSLHVMQMAVDATDADSIKLYAGINNTYYNSSGGTDGNPSSGSNPTATITGGEQWSIGFWNRNASASNIIVNFGQEGTFAGNKTAGGNSDSNGIGNFFHSVPTGFRALCTKNIGS